MLQNLVVEMVISFMAKTSVFFNWFFSLREEKRLKIYVLVLLVVTSLLMSFIFCGKNIEKDNDIKEASSELKSNIDNVKKSLNGLKVPSRDVTDKDETKKFETRQDAETDTF